VTEAQATQSTKDFIAKLSIASKESREKNYWLRLLDKSGYLDDIPIKKYCFTKVNQLLNSLPLLSSLLKGKLKIENY